MYILDIAGNWYKTILSYAFVHTVYFDLFFTDIQPFLCYCSARGKCF